MKGLIPDIWHYAIVRIHAIECHTTNLCLYSVLNILNKGTSAFQTQPFSKIKTTNFEDKIKQNVLNRYVIALMYTLLVIIINDNDTYNDNDNDNTNTNKNNNNNNNNFA